MPHEPSSIIPFDKLRQRQLNRAILKNQKPKSLPKPVPVLTQERDEEANQYVETLSPGPLTRHLSQGDHGNET